ncbi:TIR domain-containing protein [Rhizobium sophorae]|uniref:TIR domain-containing protein n=1 Tax=Rhizobium sophorae TaxID=1535242 RepID=A0A7Y3WHB0_9HYPH|nr:TIR domain-containing protein [Rhizobium sophorae]NKL39164.1 hypothetical protein [Rhizobium leguminosarum bv. viciae]NNU40585.1 TIR domain-containing protein [Rhizobium sophorae]
MARYTFFSFHYSPDIWRAQNVRNSWVALPGDEIDRGFFDASVFEAKRRVSPDILKNFLRDALDGTSVTCVLAGSETYRRRWVRYEIARSVVRGNGILTVHIQGLKNSKGLTSVKGPNPLDCLGVYSANGTIFLAEWEGTKWVKYADYASPIPKSDLWFRAPTTNTVTQLSEHCLAYDFTAQRGRENIGGWIETAAGQAGR